MKKLLFVISLFTALLLIGCKNNPVSSIDNNVNIKIKYLPENLNCTPLFLSFNKDSLLLFINEESILIVPVDTKIECVYYLEYSHGKSIKVLKSLIAIKDSVWIIK